MWVCEYVGVWDSHTHALTYSHTWDAAAGRLGRVSKTQTREGGPAGPRGPNRIANRHAAFPPLTHGRIGIRHMCTRCSRYANFRVAVRPAGA